LKERSPTSRRTERGEKWGTRLEMSKIDFTSGAKAHYFLALVCHEWNS
jgi:hypothetical protein